MYEADPESMKRTKPKQVTPDYHTVVSLEGKLGSATQ